MLPKGDRVDLFLRNQEQNLVAALMEFLRDGKTRKEMSPGAAAGDDKLFRNCHDSRPRCAERDGTPGRPDGAWSRRSGRRCGEY